MTGPWIVTKSVALLDCQQYMGVGFTLLISFAESFNQLPFNSTVSFN